jgi:beta-glucosidase
MASNKSAVDGVKKLNNKQKVSLLYGKGVWWTNAISGTPIVSIEMHDGPCGLRRPTGGKPKAGEMVEASFPSTCFPAPCLTACSWDPSLLAKMGERVGLECVHQNTDMILAPGVNIKRNPLCGRNFEYLSEDPLLAGKMAAGYIEGVQGKGVGTSLKHFAANNQEFRRLTYSSEVDQRALREIYLKPFEIAVKEAKPWTVMCSYNRINGVYSADNDWLLKNVLREEWGYQGVVISDWGATTDPVESHNHGLDIEMPCSEKRAKELARAIRKGRLHQADVDASAARIAALSDLKAARKDNESAFNYGMSHQVALSVAEQSIILAKNDRGILPLSSYQNCCIIGGLAKEARYQGGGSSEVNPQNLVSFLEAANVGGSAQGIPFAPGYCLHNGEDADKLKIDAVDLASAAKTVILVLGLPLKKESEGYDRNNMRLPEDQYQLFDAIYHVNQNIVLVLLCGAPVELPFFDQVKAALVAYLPGEAGGTAISNILLGKANPSGHFAESWPYHYTDVPSYEFYPGHGDVSLYKESIFVGYRYYLSAGKEVQFPFGYGLSYSKFAYADLKVSKDTLKPGMKLGVSFTLSNVSKVDGSEVVQLYVGENSPKVIKPLRELRAFQKIALSAGASSKVSFELSYEDFAHYDPTMERYVVEGGTYRIEIGSSSDKIALKEKIQVVSTYQTMSLMSQLPSYYHLDKPGYLKVPNEEFSILLGHQIPHEVDHHHRPFTLNSTMDDISNTFIGKILAKQVHKMVYNPDKSEEDNEAYIKMMMESPLRMIPVSGMKEGVALFVRDAANGRYLKGVWNYFFGHR